MAAPKKVLNLSSMLDKIVEGLDQKVNIFNYEPHPKQRIFHESDAHEKLFMGGNRSGKTVGSVVECIWRLTKTHPFRKELNEIEGEIRGRLVCVSFDDGLEKIILPLFKKWLPSKYLINRSWEDSYSKSLRTLTLENGSFIEFMSYVQDLEKFAGTSRHFIAYDEEPPMSIWQECTMRLLDTEGSWWISMTPVEGMTWIYNELYKKYKEGKRKNLLVIEVDTDENPHLTEFGKDLVFGDMTEEERNVRKAGGFNEYTGRIYKDFDRNIHVIQPYIPRGSDRAVIYTSLDTGFRHPAVWLWHAVFPSGRIITFHEISEAGKTVEQLASMVKEYERDHLVPHGIDTDQIVRCGDPNGLPQTKEHTGTSVQTEYAMNGLYIGTEGMTREVDIGLIRVTQYLQNKVKAMDGGAVVEVPMWQITSNCVKLIKGMEDYQWDKYASKKMEYDKGNKPTPKKVNDDEVDSARYFFVLMPELTPAKLTELKTIGISVLNDNGLYASEYSSRYDWQPKVFESSVSYSLEGY